MLSDVQIADLLELINDYGAEQREEGNADGYNAGWANGCELYKQ